MQIQAITNRNNYKIQYPRFMGRPKVATKPIQAVADTFVKSAKAPIFGTIRDIKNYLKINVDKIKDGEIFNTPITKDGDSLLMAFLHIKPIEEEEEEYESLLYKMEKMPKINYDQKDSMDMTALEWMMSAESFALLDLMKNKKLTQDPMTHTTYKHIKNPEFRKALVESGVYKPMLEILSDVMKQFSTDDCNIRKRAVEKFFGVPWNNVYDRYEWVNVSGHTYTDKEIESFKDFFAYFEYGTDNFKEDKQKFLKTTVPFVQNFLGAKSIEENRKLRDKGCPQDIRQENLLKLYYITGANKLLFKDILTALYEDPKTSIDFNNIFTCTLKEIFKDSPDDLIDIMLLPRYEFEHASNKDIHIWLRDLDNSGASKEKLDELHKKFSSWYEGLGFDEERKTIKKSIAKIEKSFKN